MVTFATLSHWLVGTLFVLSGVAKFRTPAAFRTALDESPGFWLPLTGLASRAVPILEVVVGVSLLVGFVVLPAAILAATLLIVFSIWVVTVLQSGAVLSCGCFGQTDDTLTSLVLLRNAGMIGLTGVLIGSAAWREPALDPFTAPRLAAGDLLPAGTLLAGLVVAYVLFDQLNANARQMRAGRWT
jgi:uncharacterized membrane protein YphA (DoxX/SURF4 family)